jgi:hypothetical protein
MEVAMRKFGLFYLLILVGFSYPQTLLLEENFEYSTGTLTSISSDWIESPTGSVDIQVVSGSLFFSNYISSGIGNKIVLDGGASGRSGVIRSFTSQSGNGSKVYASLIVRVTSTENMGLPISDGDRFFSLKVSGSSIFRSCIFVRQGSDSSKYQIGLGKLNSSTPSWYQLELDINTEYLFVVAYIFQTGNDIARLWVNPNLSDTEQLPDLEQTTGSDALELGEVQFRQGTLSGDMEIDGLRVATSWSEAPLPVELTSFSASVIGSKVKLNWTTATEVNNYGFDIQRQAHTSTSLSVTAWEKIGFVSGNGNSNSPKSYSFADNEVTYGKYLYRLKQIDNDGQFEYSKTVEVNLGSPKNYDLSQNYPNPFNPTTIISYILPEASNVKLTLYNLLGQEVKALVDEFMEAGAHAADFNAENLNSGVYIYKLQAGSFTQTRKMTLIK